MSLLKKIIASVLIGFGALLTIGAIVNLEEGKGDTGPFSTLAIWLLFGLAPLSVGILMLYQQQKSSKRKAMGQAQATLLRYAQKQQNRITIAEATVALNAPLELAKKTLDEMQARNIFELALSDEGTLVYIINPTYDGADSASAQKLI
ncbi:MAG: hypothetical protein HC913_15290 [Microscillaceae bacterium]|nr:hypothetical protein [Microscillaceae bacterium]